MRKVTRIVALLLKDQTAPKELYKSVLKYLKVVITFLQFNEGSAKELCELILTHTFSLKNSAKYTMIIRKILNKLIARVGVTMVLQCTAKEHQKLIHYIERLRRKVKNAKERQRFAATSGGAAAVDAEADKEMMDEDSDEMSEGDDDDAMEVEGPQGASDAEDESVDSDDSDADGDEDGPRGVDRLQIANGIDIPQGINIPVVSQLAKEAYKRE